MGANAEGVPAIAPRAALEARDALLLDLRAPVEFAEDHLEGALNVPLFDDVERALVGTLYARQSPEKAFETARELVLGDVGELVARIEALAGWQASERDLRAVVGELTEGGIAALERRVAPLRIPKAPERAVVLHCWRGGLRSRSVAALLRALGLERAVVIEGGYKACRAEVVSTLETFRAPQTFVLRGLTGVGKTLVLRELERLRPGWTIDLEGLAQHRSSVLGGAGLAPVKQKRFESALARRIERGLPGPLVLEGESRKVGDVIVPGPLWRALDGAGSLMLVAPLERRVDVLIADYLATPTGRDELVRGLEFLETRVDPAGREPLVRLLESGRERELVALLLERWYDPRYRHAEQGRRHLARFDSSDPAACAHAIAGWIDDRAGPAR
ncbi:MAG: tRNA 2-selenouridine(34) synthase MnmH [Planctomycetota bacterium]|nr:tRNA 2-selenouridine(34) synthase MnmH [Planctomycetota bacterium]